MDVGKQKETLKFLERSDYELYVPSHAEPTDNISHLVEVNLNVMERVEEFLLSVSGTTDEVMRKLCSEFGIKLTNFTDYSLMLATLKAYLSYLHDRGDVHAEFGDTLHWKRIP